MDIFGAYTQSASDEFRKRISDLAVEDAIIRERQIAQDIRWHSLDPPPKNDPLRTRGEGALSNG